jgi:hypothetical protein
VTCRSELCAPKAVFSYQHLSPAAKSDVLRSLRSAADDAPSYHLGPVRGLSSI